MEEYNDRQKEKCRILKVVTDHIVNRITKEDVHHELNKFNIIKYPNGIGIHDENDKDNGFALYHNLDNDDPLVNYTVEVNVHYMGRKSFWGGLVLNHPESEEHYRNYKVHSSTLVKMVEEIHYVMEEIHKDHSLEVYFKHPLTAFYNYYFERFIKHEFEGVLLNAKVEE